MRGIAYVSEVPVPVVYHGVKLDCGYRADIVVEGAVVVELKSIAAIDRVHEAQLLTYMKLGGWRLGLLMNFNVVRLVDGIKRIVHNFPE